MIDTLSHLITCVENQICSARVLLNRVRLHLQKDERRYAISAEAWKLVGWLMSLNNQVEPLRLLLIKVSICWISMACRPLATQVDQL